MVPQNLLLIMFMIAVLVPTPQIFLSQSELPQAVIGQPQDLVCLVSLSSSVDPNTVQLMWNFTSTDSRVTVIPTTVNNDDTIGNIYSTVIQFTYLMEGDEGNYVCSLTVGDSVESNFELELIGKYINMKECIQYPCDIYIYIYIYTLRMSFKYIISL